MANFYRLPNCHPDRPYAAKGMCRKCYDAKWKSEHPEKARQYVKKWHDTHPNQRWYIKHADRYLLAKLRKYDITLEEYNALLEAQGGVCAICGAKGVLNIDHCHETSKVRGLLCTLCNVGIGKFKDDPDHLQQASEYLRARSLDNQRNESL